MKQHPIPQDITNYKFHLIGQMTLKQFAILAVGVILAFVIFKTNLIGIIKWPLIFLSVGLGAMIAFVPIEERPLDHWIKTFFKNIYKPTKFFWKKANKIPDFFNYKITSVQDDYFAPNVNLNPAKRQRISDYIKSIPTDERLDSFDMEENQKINNLLSQFENVKVDKEDIEIEVQKQEKPNLRTRVRKLKSPVQTFVLNTDHLPNQVYGLVVDEDGKPVSQAIIEIKDENGKSVRITKSDIDGNFSTNKTLLDGKYQVEVEKNNQKYPNSQIELSGEVLNPLVIKP